MYERERKKKGKEKVNLVKWATLLEYDKLQDERALALMQQYQPAVG
jgi:hypothetical protein